MRSRIQGLTGLRRALWGFAGLLGVILLALSVRDALRGNQEAVIVEARAYLKAGEAYRERLEALQELEARSLGQAAANARRAAQAVARAQRFSQSADSLAALRAFAPDTAKLALAEAEIRALRSENAGLREAVGAQQEAITRVEFARRTAGERADLSNQRVDSLEAHLARVLRVAECQILGLVRCPSRVQAALLGAGVVAVLFVTR